jgi:tetratricopeptide (TPR) repeat protein
VDKKGKLHATEGLQVGFNTNFNLQLIEGILKTLESRLKKEHDYKLLSDYSVLLLKAGRTKESIAILSVLSKQYPNEYQIAANLGTAYELNGETDQAIKFIKRAIKLNPNSHNGSEWVHIKVLETKKRLALEPSYLSHHTVLNLSEADKKDTLVREQILIQVRERFPFSPGPNPIMASILIDLGDCYANTSSIEFAKVLYTIAKLYFGANGVLVDSKINEMVALRIKFSELKPEEVRRDGENILLGGISYKSMLDNNNSSNYKIDWQHIQLNVDSLLSYVSLSREKSTSHSVDKQDSEGDFEQNKIKEEKKDNKLLIYSLLGGLSLLLIVILILKTRSVNKTQKSQHREGL